MALLQNIDQALIQELKQKNELAVLTLRGLKSALINAKIAKKDGELTEEEEIKVLRTEAKKRKESIELYTQGDRPELAQREEQELAIIQNYLPAQMSDDQIRGEVKTAVEQTKAQGMADMGKVIGVVMKKLAGQADGSAVSRIVKEELG